MHPRVAQVRLASSGTAAHPSAEEGGLGQKPAGHPGRLRSVLGAASSSCRRRVQVMRVAPYAVHPSYVFGGLEARRHRLREGHIWLDPPAYYQPAQRLLTVELHVPAVPDTFERLRSDYLVDMHLKLVQHQLDQVCSRVFRIQGDVLHVAGVAVPLHPTGTPHPFPCV